MQRQGSSRQTANQTSNREWGTNKTVEIQEEGGQVAAKDKIIQSYKCSTRIMQVIRKIQGAG